MGASSMPGKVYDLWANIGFYTCLWLSYTCPCKYRSLYLPQDIFYLSLQI